MSLVLGTPAGALGQTAAAEEPAAGTPEARERALELFEESEKPYREGRFDEAARLLEQAYALYPEPVLLYNLARAYEGMGKNEQALDAYRRFLDSAPKAKDRGAIERRIETLEKQIAEQERLEAERRRLEAEKKRRDAQPEPAPPKREPSSGGPGIWPYVTAGAGVAIVGAGVAFGVLAQSKRNDADEDPEHRSARETFRQAETFATTANILFIAGGLVTAGGVTWIVLAKPWHKEQSALRLGVGPGSVAVGGSF